MNLRVSLRPMYRMYSADLQYYKDNSSEYVLACSFKRDSNAAEMNIQLYSCCVGSPSHKIWWN